MKVLETERTTLRWFREDDAPFLLALLNDPDWIRNIGQRNVHSLNDARRFIADKLVATYWEKGLGLWAMERRSDGVLLGMCGLVDRESLPEIDVGYALAPAFRGAGYTREGAAASLRYARDVLGKRQVLAIVWPENRESIRVLDAIGMTSEGTRLLAGDPREAAVFSWGRRLDAPAAAEDANTAIDSLIARFFAAFSNRSGLTKVASLPSLFVPGAVVTVVKPEAAHGVETVSVRDFLTPRAALLSEGRLTDVHEEEVTSHTEVTGQLASRSSRYRKSGVLDGVPFQGEGSKHFQLVHTTRGWKIAALAWEDDAKRAGECAASFARARDVRPPARIPPLMRILIIGASQGTGALAVRAALDKGHTVTAFARSPSKLTMQDARLEKRAGDFHQEASVTSAVAGHDAVIITASTKKLSTFKENPHYFSQGTRYVIDAMKKAQVKRLVVLSALGAGESRPLLNGIVGKLLRDVVLKRPFDDHDRQEAMVRASGLEWVIARPTRLTNGRATGKYEKTAAITKVPSSIHRADVAAFLVESCESTTWVGSAVQLGG